MVFAKFHESFELLEVLFQGIRGDDDVINKWENAGAARPEFESFLQLALTEVCGVHEPKCHAFVAINLRRRQVITGDDEGDLVAVFLRYLELMEPAAEVKGGVNGLAAQSVKRLLHLWDGIRLWDGV